MTGGVDPITAEVVSRHLLAIAEEMAATMIRAAFSPNIKERADCSSAVFDAAGQVIAQAHRVPIHLGSMIGAVDEIRRRFAAADIRPGDMFIANDPYNGGGSHLPDINAVAPVFWRDRIVAYVASIAHHADVGGMLPGSEAAVCRTIFQEGLRLPPVRIMRAGELNRDLLDVIQVNSRTPEERLGDLRAQFAANLVGVRSVAALFDRYGARTAPAIAAYLDFTERRFAAAIRRLPPGTWSAGDFLDGDAAGTLAPIRLRLTVGDGRLGFDFAGSAPQLDSARNIPRQALLATIYTVAKSLLDPGVPANAGYFRTLDVTAPAGSLVQPEPPAAVGCRSISCGVLGDVVAAALSQAMPARALAASGPHHLVVFAGSHPRSGRFFVNYETIAGGMGARPYADGMDGVRVHASGAANLPVEALEHAYPLRVERYALWDGSGGAGAHRGGAGVVRDYRMLADGITVSLSSERQHAPARGLAGGGDGAPGCFLRDPGTPDEVQLAAASADVALPRGSVLRICTPGGGGYGIAAAPRPGVAGAGHAQSGAPDRTARLIRALRSSFPGAERWTYFDVAARGLLSRQTRAAIDRHLDARLHDGGDKAAMFAAVELARGRFAALVGAAADDIAFTRNVSDGINSIAAAIDWRPGDNVVLCAEVEHPANIFPWYGVRDRHGVALRRVPGRGGHIDPAALLAATDARTRLVTASTVSFAPGFRTDVDAIGRRCRERGIFFLVDAAQSAGILHLDLATTAIDALSVATQKGLLGVYGMGFLFVRRAWADRLQPAYRSRFGVDLGHAHEAASGAGPHRLMAGARRFDVGNYNYIGCVAAAAALQQVLEIGPAAVERHVLALSHALAHGLLELGLPVFGGAPGAHLAHIVTLGSGLADQHDATDDAMLRALYDTLLANRVKLSIRRGMLRFSAHVYNNNEDVARTLAIVRRWRAGG